MFIDDRHDFGDRLAASAAHVPTRQVLSHGIDVVNVAICIGRNDAITDGLQRHLRPLLFLKHARLGAFAVGNIGDSAFVRDDVFIVVIDSTRIFEDDNFGAILASQAVLEILDDTLRFQPGEHALAVDRVDVQHRRLADCLHFLDAVVAQHLNERRVSRYEFAFARRDVDTVHHVFEQPAIAGFTVSQLVLVLLPLDRDAGEARHATQLVQLICGWFTRIVYIDVHRANDTTCSTVQKE